MVGEEEIIALFSQRPQIAQRDGGVTRHLGDERGLGRRNSKDFKHSGNKIILEACLHYSSKKSAKLTQLN